VLVATFDRMAELLPRPGKRMLEGEPDRRASRNPIRRLLVLPLRRRSSAGDGRETGRGGPKPSPPESR
jgi:hypothetical protein